MEENLLEVKDLTIHYIVQGCHAEAVNGISFSLKKGETLGLVGETGAGKTTTALSMMGLIPNPPGKVIKGEILFENEDLLKKSEREMRAIRGRKISMIFQDPMTSLNPLETIGEQIAEVIRTHNKISKVQAAIKAEEMLNFVGIQSNRYNDYPHQFSGGMKQRALIAIALACNPALLIADEPTTALDVTIQAQVLELMRNLKKDFNTSMLLITHDLGVVAETCDKVAVMYAGEIIESGTLDQIFNHTKHPYTQGLFESIPSMDEDVHRLKPIGGLMPDPMNLPEGCKFGPRCPYKTKECEKNAIDIYEVAENHMVKCIKFKR